MSTAATKTSINPTWTTQKIQEAAASAFAMQAVSSMSVLSKYGEQAIHEFQDMMHKYQFEHMKAIGVRTPLDFVKAKAEFECNVFGSKIDIEGDDNRAQLKYSECGMFNAMQKIVNFTPETQEKFGQHFQNCAKDFAKMFGFNCEVNMEGEAKKMTLTYSK